MHTGEEKTDCDCRHDANTNWPLEHGRPYERLAVDGMEEEDHVHEGGKHQYDPVKLIIPD